MENQQRTSEEVNTLYFTIALLQASKHYLGFLIEENKVGGILRNNMNEIVKKIERLDKAIKLSVSPEAYEIWSKEWKERDYRAFAGVFEIMVNMDDRQREKLEEMAAEIKYRLIPLEQCG